MPALTRCTSVHGNTTILKRNPRIDVYEDVLYVPYGVHGARPGLYDSGRKMISAAATFRGIPEIAPIHESYVTSLDPHKIDYLDIDEPITFCGFIADHYGHFLLSTLSRFWSERISGPDKDAKYLILNHGGAAPHFANEFVQVTMNLIGLTNADFVAFDRPVRLRSVRVPSVSFEENNFAHKIYAHFCNALGKIATASSSVKDNVTPVYLSKERLKKGVSTILNESDVTKILESNGVTIAYPEEMTLVDQMRIFQERRIIVATIGSALHTGIFSPSNNLIILNHSNVVWSNQLLIDGANDNTSVYLYPEGGMQNQGPNDRFGNNFVLHDPRSIAEGLLREIDMAAK